jgi:hypothetical protein
MKEKTRLESKEEPCSNERSRIDLKIKI